MSRKNGKSNRLTKAQKAEVKQIVDNKIDEEIEDKTFTIGAENQQLYHNKPFYVAKLMSAIEQGVGDGDQSSNSINGPTKCRIGDALELKNINIRMWMSNKLDRPNVMYKGVLFWYPVAVPPSDTEVYKTQSNKMLDRYNNKNIRIIDQFIVRSTNNYAVDANNHEHSYLTSFNKNYKRKKITYDGLDGFPKKMDLGFALVTYDAYGTLQTDNIASFAWQACITFQDA